MGSPSVGFGVSTEGKSVAEALIADEAQAVELLAAARDAGSALAWAHSAADLSGLGFSRQSGYRKVPGERLAPCQGGGAAEPLADEDSPWLWAAAFRGQWGHKTPPPDQWPFDLPPETVTLCLRRQGEIAGVCRVDTAAGLIDAPGVLPAYRADLSVYEVLLRAGAALVDTPTIAVESWGEGPERLAVCERLGLTTAEYTPGWELVLHTAVEAGG